MGNLKYKLINAPSADRIFCEFDLAILQSVWDFLTIFNPECLREFRDYYPVDGDLIPVDVFMDFLETDNIDDVSPVQGFINFLASING